MNVDTVRKVLDTINRNRDADDVGEILMQEILDRLRTEGDMTDEEYSILWKEFLPVEEPK